MSEPLNGMTKSVDVGGAHMTIVARDPKINGVEWQLRYGDPAYVRWVAASLISSYSYLCSPEITTKEAMRRLRLMRKASRP